ncbi:MAG: glycosyltransferase family 4 protein [Streptosporangiaceae bacterium]
MDLEVAFLSKRGAEPYRDPGFGVTVTWDVDLLDGYRWISLDRKTSGSKLGWLLALSRWLRRQDIVVLHGHANPKMLLAVALCRALNVPYLLRGESHAESATTGWRRSIRHLLASFTVTGAAGALPIGELNTGFYERYGHIPHFRAPYSVDNDRFRNLSGPARASRSKRLESIGLDPKRLTVIFSGKLTPRKRPLDAVRAIERCHGQLNLVILGDGPLRAELVQLGKKLPVRCLGFVNQADLPIWYATGEILVLPSESEPWGLVVNEGMACGLIPVVSKAVGCATDLVDGIGEIVPVGDIDALAAALMKAASDLPSRQQTSQRRLERFGMTETAKGYEEATLSLTGTTGGSLIPADPDNTNAPGGPDQ